MDEARVREIFAACDRDGDGRITRRELAEGLHRLQIPSSQAALDHFMTLVDVNRDGCLSFAEFHAAVLMQTERLRRAFKEVDHGGDNRITSKDVERFAEKLGWALSHAEVKALMAALDRGQRGHVELGGFVETFFAVAGQATHAEGLFEAWMKEAPISALAVPDAPAAEVPSWITLASGAMAGMLSRTLTAPADRIKTLLQASFGGAGGGAVDATAAAAAAAGRPGGGGGPGVAPAVATAGAPLQAGSSSGSGAVARHAPMSNGAASALSSSSRGGHLSQPASTQYHHHGAHPPLCAWCPARPRT
jgi:Ca2+-binding EF-hand superfamily protein